VICERTFSASTVRRGLEKMAIGPFWEEMYAKYIVQATEALERMAIDQENQ